MRIDSRYRSRISVDLRNHNLIAFIVSIAIVCFFILLSFGFVKSVKAENLSDSINEQIENLDLENLKKYFDSLENANGIEFYSFLDNLLNGNFKGEYNTFFGYVLSMAFSDFSDTISVICSIIAITLLCSLFNLLKPSLADESVGEIVNLVCLFSILIILSSKIVPLFLSVKNIIQNLTNLCEIMSPIILSLLISSGGTVSASLYSPAVSFLTGGVSAIILNVLLPLVALTLIFHVFSNVCGGIKFNKFADFFSSVIKWVTGITVTIFGIFISVQGIGGAVHDGISIKTAKYAIGNTVPLIGGFLRDGLDFIMVGSVLIKNSIGIIGIFSLFYTILPPVLYMIVLSLGLKLASAVSEPFSDGKVSELLNGVSKSIGSLIACVLLLGFMIFVTVLLIIFTANAFI